MPLRLSSLVVVVLALVTLALSGCADSPARAFEKFYEALAEGDGDAIERLSARARGALDDDARRALLTTPPRAGVKSVRVIEDSSDSATLEVTDVLGETQRVRMVLEDGAWRVDL